MSIEGGSVTLDQNTTETKQVLSKEELLKKVEEHLRNFQITPEFIAKLGEKLKKLDHKHAKENHEIMYGKGNNITFDGGTGK